MVSPPDEHGYVSFGTTVDYTKGTTDYCEVVIAQVNKCMPRTFGNSIKHVRDFTCFVEFDEELPEVVSGEPSAIDMEIGKIVLLLSMTVIVCNLVSVEFQMPYASSLQIKRSRTSQRTCW